MRRNVNSPAFSGFLANAPVLRERLYPLDCSTGFANIIFIDIILGTIYRDGLD